MGEAKRRKQLDPQGYGKKGRKNKDENFFLKLNSQSLWNCVENARRMGYDVCLFDPDSQEACDHLKRISFGVRFPIPVHIGDFLEIANVKE